MDPFLDPNLIVGLGTSDDAAVYRIAPDQAVIVTVDYFTPIHDDPRTFGRIAATNSLSDVYAMGGKPFLAINVCGFPACSMPLELMNEVLQGGRSTAAEAGIAVAGGHTIDSPEPFYGMCVLGIVHPDRVITNSAAREGDAVILTKPLGTGVIMSAMMFDAATEEAVDRAAASMTTLNRRAAEIMLDCGAHAATDVTGFGLVGHGHEMAQGSGLEMHVELAAVPMFDEALEYAGQWIVTGGGQRNREYYGQWVDFGPAGDEQIAVLCDPQTSGGLLISLPPDAARNAVEQMRAEGLPAAIIGAMQPGEPGRIVFR